MTQEVPRGITALPVKIARSVSLAEAPPSPALPELTASPHKEQFRPIVENTSAVFFFGIHLPKNPNRGGIHETTEFSGTETDLRTMRAIALAFATDIPVLYEGPIVEGRITSMDEITAKVGWSVVEIDCSNEKPFIYGKSRQNTDHATDGSEAPITVIHLKNINLASPSKVRDITHLLTHITNPEDHHADSDLLVPQRGDSGNGVRLFPTTTKVLASIPSHLPSDKGTEIDPLLERAFLRINGHADKSTTRRGDLEDKVRAKMSGLATDKGLTHFVKREQPLTEQELTGELTEALGVNQEDLIQRITGFLEPLPLADAHLDRLFNIMRTYTTSGGPDVTLRETLKLVYAAGLPPRQRTHLEGLIDDPQSFTDPRKLATLVEKPLIVPEFYATERYTRIRKGNGRSVIDALDEAVYEVLSRPILAFTGASGFAIFVARMRGWI